MPHFVTYDVTLHRGRTRDRITLVVKLDKTRKSRKFRDGESLVTCGWYGIVRQPFTEQGWRVVAPGIEFNAHCYQRRKDVTQLHCLAGLVTAGDIINRLRAPRRPSPFLAGPLLRIGEIARGYQEDEQGGCARGGNAIFCIGKHHRFLVTRDLVIAVYRARGKWNSRGALSSSEVSTAFIKRMNLHKEPLNLQGE